MSTKQTHTNRRNSSKTDRTTHAEPIDETARDQALADWAEHDMALPKNSTTARRGTAAAAHGRAALEAALGGPTEVERAVRGRKTLGQDKPGGRSPKRQVTMSTDLDARALAYIEAGGADNFSTLARNAIDEYLQRRTA